MIYVLYILVGILVGLPLLRLFIFMASNRKAGLWGEVRKLCSGRTAVSLLRAYLTGILSEATAPALFPLGLGREEVPNGRGTPVLLVHGLYHNRSAWRFFRKSLAEEGFTSIRAITYGSWRGGFEDALTTVRRELRRTLDANPGRKVLLVGHSLGGVLLRVIASEDEFRERVGALVTLGSPFGGSDLAHLGIGALARSLKPDGVACRAQRAMKDVEAPKLAVYSPVDDFVFPLNHLNPGAGWQLHDCEPMSHVWLLYSPQVAGTVAAFLKHYR